MKNEEAQKSSFWSPTPRSFMAQFGPAISSTKCAYPLHASFSMRFYAMHLAVLSLSMETLGGPIPFTALPRLYTQLMVHAQLMVHVTKAFACKVGISHLHEVIYSFPSYHLVTSASGLFLCISPATHHRAALPAALYTSIPLTSLPTMLVCQPHHLEHSCTYRSLMTASTAIYAPDMVGASAPVDFLHA